MSSEFRARFLATASKESKDQALASNSDSREDAQALLVWRQLPEWARDNEYVHGGYRPISYSYRKSIKSCFYIHNESGNIYSHLLATIWMLVLPMYLYPFARTHYPAAGPDDWIIFGLFFLGGALCYALSTGYHAVSNHSHAVHDVYLRLDLLGISIVTAGCFLPGIWYTFPCLAREKKILWISVRALRTVK